jgi:hypothetical protein
MVITHYFFHQLGFSHYVLTNIPCLCHCHFTKLCHGYLAPHWEDGVRWLTAFTAYKQAKLVPQLVPSLLTHPKEEHAHIIWCNTSNFETCSDLGGLVKKCDALRMDTLLKSSVHQNANSVMKDEGVVSLLITKPSYQYNNIGCFQEVLFA